MRPFPPPPADLVAAWERAARQFTDRGITLIDRRGRTGDRRSYPELVDRFRLSARRLARRGIGPGDRVLVALGTSWEWLDTWFGALFLGLLVPAGGLGQSGPQIAAERYTYQPAWVLTAGCVLLAARAGWLDRAPGRVAAVVVLAALAAATWLQQRHWRDTESLWVRELGVHPDNAFANFVLGYHYLSRSPPAFPVSRSPWWRSIRNCARWRPPTRTRTGSTTVSGCSVSISPRRGHARRPGSRPARSTVC